MAAPALAHPLPPLPATPRANAEMGARFAACSAYDQFAAAMAGRANLPQIRDLEQARAREWRFSGIFFVGRGLDPAASSTSVSRFDALVATKVLEMRARLGGDVGTAMAAASMRYEQDCEPLSALQQGVVEALRTGQL